MKKLLILALFFGCREKNIIPAEEKIPNYKIVTDDRGCEYYKEYVGAGTFIYIHVGRCKNPLHYFKDNNTYKYFIDLPEEFPLISTSILHPDTLTGYISRDTLYIGFLKYKNGKIIR
jgi:hypothetical protein